MPPHLPGLPGMGYLSGPGLSPCNLEMWNVNACEAILGQWDSELMISYFPLYSSEGLLPRYIS